MSLTILNSLTQFQNINPNYLKSVPVTMCLWKRIENLKNTLNLLNSQSNLSFDLFLCNNNIDIHQQAIDIINASNLNFNVYLFNSNSNLGGYGRFFISKELLTLNHYKFSIFIDDDESFSNSMINDFLLEAKPNKMTSIWAHSFSKNQPYHIRRKVNPNESCHYCGTGGMIVDINLFNNPNVFLCPDKYKFIEDLWISYVAHSSNFLLTGSNANITIDHFDNKGMGTWHNGIASLKIEMLNYLRSKGWNV